MNCVIVHGCPSDVEKAMDPATRTYDKHWLPWVREKLNERGIKTEIAIMPEPWKPDYERFKKAFAKYNITKDTILVGHSCGTAFLLHWLGDTRRNINKLILVAPWVVADEKDESTRGFYEYPIDKSIKERVNEIIVFTSNNDYLEGRRSAKIVHNTLGGELINLKNHGHFTENDMGTIEFLELLKEI